MRFCICSSVISISSFGLLNSDVKLRLEDIAALLLFVIFCAWLVRVGNGNIPHRGAGSNLNQYRARKQTVDSKHNRLLTRAVLYQSLWITKQAVDSKQHLLLTRALLYQSLWTTNFRWSKNFRPTFLPLSIN